MSVLKVNIEGFGDLPVTPAFPPSSRFNRRGSGDVQSVEDRWGFTGTLPALAGEDADDLELKRAALIAIFEQSFGTITFKANSTEIDKIGPDTHVNGARFQNFDVQVSGGEWVNLLVYRFTVVGIRALVVPDVPRFQTTFRFDEERKDDGTLSTTTVKTVNAEGPGALTLVQAEKPANARRSMITNNETDQIVQGTFTIPAEDDRSQGEFVVEERLSIEPGIFPPEFSRGTRSNSPKRFLSSRIESRVSLDGSVSGRFGDKQVVIPLSKSFAEALAAPPRFVRNVPPRSGKAATPEPAITVEYSFQFAFEEPISANEILADRQSFKSSDFSASESSLTGSAKDAAKLGVFVKSA